MVRKSPLPVIPEAPSSIEAGSSLGEILGPQAIRYLANNIQMVYPQFDRHGFQKFVSQGLDPLGIMARGPHIAQGLRLYLPQRFERAVDRLLASLTPPLTQTEGNGLKVFFYHPHASFVSEFGLDAANNDGIDPFDVSMNALYELTQRFTAEFSIRPFLIQQQARTLKSLIRWTGDPNPHVRRLCSEGTRPRLPWAPRIPALIADPTPTFPILDALKDDPSLYVRRSVANHLGDIAKNHTELALDLCQQWSRGASPETQWLIRHALRYPAKKGHESAQRLRAAMTSRSKRKR